MKSISSNNPLGNIGFENKNMRVNGVAIALSTIIWLAAGIVPIFLEGKDNLGPFLKLLFLD